MDQRHASTRARRAGLVAAACVGALALPAAGVVAARAVGNDPAAARLPAQVDDEFACTGPPPFAGEVPEGATKAERAANRHVEVLAFALWRAANCPVDSGAPDGEGCTGAPDFAGTPADPADPEASVVPSPRADEAAALAELRSECQDTTSSEVLEASATPGVPESVPAGPPDSLPAGPPDSVPVGPPDGVPAGPPDSLPAAPPEGAPAGPPASLPAGPPEGLPPGAPGNG